MSGRLVFVGLAVLSCCGSVAESADESAKVALQKADWQGVQKLVAEHRGKVVLVDVWTTTCLVCVEEFPKLVELQKRLGKDKVAVISVNCDYDGVEGKPPDYYRKDVLAFLKEQEATFENVLLTVPFIDFLNQVELSSTPAVYVYGPDGKLVKRFDNDDSESAEEDFHVADVETLVKELLAKGK